MIKIVADSACDIFEVPDTAFAAVPLTISTDKKTYTDSADLDVSSMLKDLAAYKGRSYTACPSASSWLSAFEGADQLIIFTLTGGLSGTYNSACLAGEMYKEEHPDIKFFAFDSKSAGPEIRLLIEKTADLIHKGLAFEEICAKIPEYSKKLRTFFAFRSLHNFAQNGRVNKVVASAIEKLNITILGTASEEGTISILSKCRGEKKVLAQLVNEMIKAGYQGGRFLILHIENRPLAVKMQDAIKTLFPDSEVLVYEARGICSYYGEEGGMIVSFEC